MANELRIVVLFIMFGKITCTAAQSCPDEVAKGLLCCFGINVTGYSFCNFSCDEKSSIEEDTLLQLQYKTLSTLQERNTEEEPVWYDQMNVLDVYYKSEEGDNYMCMEQVHNIANDGIKLENEGVYEDAEDSASYFDENYERQNLRRVT